MECLRSWLAINNVWIDSKYCINHKSFAWIITLTSKTWNWLTCCAREKYKFQAQFQNHWLIQLVLIQNSWFQVHVYIFSSFLFGCSGLSLTHAGIHVAPVFKPFCTNTTINLHLNHFCSVTVMCVFTNGRFVW